MVEVEDMFLINALQCIEENKRNPTIIVTSDKAHSESDLIDDMVLVNTLQRFEKQNTNSRLFISKAENSGSNTIEQQAKHTVSNKLGEAKSASGQTPIHRAKLKEKQKDYLGRTKKKQTNQKTKNFGYNFPSHIRLDPNFLHFLKMKQSKSRSNRNKDGLLCCIFCSKDDEPYFKTASSLHRHYLEQHYDKCPSHWMKQYYECEKCDRTFKRKEHYEQHCLSDSHKARLMVENVDQSIEQLQI